MTETRPEPADETLMVRAGQGDREAFVALVRRHQGALVNHFRRLGDYSHAEDMAQETFLRVFRYRSRYRPTAKFTTFLYLLARRTRIDHVRKVVRRQAAHEELAREGAGDPERPGAADEVRGRVEAALGSLTEELRSVVVMSVYQGFKYREIAEVLEIPVGTVKTRMFHAIRRLKEALGHGQDG